MYFPSYRPRRLRKNENFRRMIRETKLSVDDLVYPLFVTFGKNMKKPINSMPGHFQMSVDNLIKEIEKARDLVIPAILLFPLSFFSASRRRRTRRLPEPSSKTASSSRL